MARSVTARSLYEALRERLKLHWVAGGVGEERAILVEDLTLRPATVGYLNLIHPNKIQVLGIEERQYLERLEPAEFEATVSRMFDSAPIAIVFGDSLEVPAQILSRANGSPTALIRSARRSHEVVTYLQYHVSRALARKTTLHGVYMELFTMGVLITGGAGTGKSELALELLTRGHRLVADDAPEFTHRVARRLHRKLPHTPIIDYVCPSVWAWRQGRTRVVDAACDRVLCLFPFERSF